VTSNCIERCLEDFRLLIEVTGTFRFWSNLGRRRKMATKLTRRRAHPRVPSGVHARCGYRRRETAQ
jgi:hypothetical protein